MRVPPKLVDVPAASAVVDVLRVLGVEHVAGRVTRRGGRARSSGQIIVVPTIRVPPELVNVPVRATKVDVLCPLGIEHVASGVTRGRRRTGDSGQIVVVPGGTDRLRYSRGLSE